MSQAHAADISPLEGEPPQRACSPRGDFPRAARTGVLLAVMLIVFLSACGGNSETKTGNGTQQETSELADDSADNDSAFATEEIPSEEFAVPECDDEALRTDRASLTALYNATDGPNWTDNTNWLTDAPLSEWAGVNSLSFTGSECVTLLLLSGNQLSGEIPAELGNLTTLKSLGLEFNQLSGEIPAELENLTTLKWLRLSLNQLSGEIPAELENLTTLKSLGLSFNQLSGEIPAELENLTTLERLDLAFNQLSGEIPAELGNLTTLEELGLEFNQLSGEIPAELENLTTLKSLDLAGNQLSGEIPAELGNLTTLEHLSLGDNQLSGCIPASLRHSSGDIGEMPYCDG